MRETLRQLIELQRLDDELHRLTAAIEALPAEREAAERALEEGRGRLAEAEQRLEALQLGLRAAESALQDAEELRKRLEAQQSQVKTNEAYTALLHEIEVAGEAISEAETRILEGMDATQEGRTQLEAEGAAAGGLEASTQAHLREIEEKGEALRGEREQTEAARVVLAGQIPGAALQRYRKVASRKRPAVALLENKVCSGCGIGISPQLYVDMIAGEDLVVCGSCRRILILPKALESGATG